MTKIVDLFGIAALPDTDVSWNDVITAQNCPFVGRRCFKVRKSNPSTSIGTCTVVHSRLETPIVICPNRLLERQQIFLDCLHLLHGHAPGNELHVISEVHVPGGSIDYVLVSVLDRKVRDFVAIEIQTVDTVGSVWPERQRLLRELELDVEEADIRSESKYGMNWKMTAKTILLQLHHKVTTFENMKKHLVLVLQDRLLAYLSSNFQFDHVNLARETDTMQFHSYAFVQESKRNRIFLADRFSTDAEGVARCLGLNTAPNVDLDEFRTTIESKLSESSLLVLPIQSGGPNRTLIGE